MAENDHRGAAPSVNPESSETDQTDLLQEVGIDYPARWIWMELLETVLAWLKQWFPVPPRLVPGTVLLRGDVERNFGISDHTFVRWRSSGLKTLSGFGTRSEIVLADDLIDFFKSGKQLVPAYESPHAAKNKARKRKEN